MGYSKAHPALTRAIQKALANGAPELIEQPATTPRATSASPLGAIVSLDDHVAMVNGRYLPWGRVSALNGPQVTLAWATIERVVATDGKFFSARGIPS